MPSTRLALALVLSLSQAPFPVDGATRPDPSVVPQTAATSAKIWPGRYAEIEEQLKTARVVHSEELGVGVTNPLLCRLDPSDPVGSLVFKAIPPGRHRGFWDSYRSEIAAYELDKLLELDMVPVAVERYFRGDPGAAIMLLEPVESWEDLIAAAAKPADPQGWARQVIRMQMFDNLIGNEDRNAGNLLVDPAWNLLLIDHSRAFSDDTDLLYEMGRIDRGLWDRMVGLSETALSDALEPWVGSRALRGLLERRTRMQDAIETMVEAKGEAGVFLR